MNTTKRSRVIRFAESQASLPGPAGEHAVSFPPRVTLNAVLSLRLAFRGFAEEWNIYSLTFHRSELKSRMGLRSHVSKRRWFKACLMIR
jgi:hypothetical protein